MKVFNHAPSIMAISTIKDGKFVNINNTFLEKLGYKREEVLGKTSADLNLLMNYEQRAEIIQLMKEKGYTRGIEVDIRSKKGDHLYGLFSAETIQLQDGEYLFTTMSDITKSKETEKKLRKSEEKYRILFEGAANPITIVDRNGIILMINNAGAKNLGLLPEKCKGKSIFEILPSMGKDFHQIYSRIIDTGIKETREQMVELPTGTKWYLSYYQPVSVPLEILDPSSSISSENGKNHGVQIISYDITEKKLSELKLIESEKKFRIAVENSPDFIMFIDTDGIIFDVNRLEGDFTRDMVIDQSVFSDYFYETKEQCESARRMISDTIETRKMNSYEISLITPDGLRSFYEVRVSPFEYDNEDNIISLQLLTRNITDKKKLELNLQKHMQQLEESLKEKEIILKELHHRVKNNLQIISSITILHESRIDEKNRDIFKGYQNRIKAMANIHESLHQTENIEHLEIKYFISNLIEDIITIYNVDLNRIKINLDIDMSEFINVSEAMHYGLIINELVSNALKHAFPKKNKGNITVSIKKSGNNTIVLEVQDDGIGFQDNINFTNPTTMGMKIVTTSIKQLNGAINLKSPNEKKQKNGKGTNWVITFKEK